jgi:hypothetical protein
MPSPRSWSRARRAPRREDRRHVPFRQSDEGVVLQQDAGEQPGNGGAAAVAEGTLEIAVGRLPQVAVPDPEQAGGPGALLVARLDEQDEPPGHLGRDHPAPHPAGELAVHVGAGHRIVQHVAIGKPQPPLDADLDQRPGVRLLRLAQLVPAVAAGVRRGRVPLVMRRVDL